MIHTCTHVAFRCVYIHNAVALYCTKLRPCIFYGSNNSNNNNTRIHRHTNCPRGISHNTYILTYYYIIHNNNNIIRGT